MRLALRFVLPLIAILSLIAYATIPLFEALDRRWAVRDVEVRARMIANTASEALFDLIQARDERKILRYFKRAVEDERLYALGYCDADGRLRYFSGQFPERFSCADPDSFKDSVRNLHVSVYPIAAQDQQAGNLILMHDMGFVGVRSGDTKRYLFGLFIVLGLVISFANVVIARLSQQNLMGRMRAALRGGSVRRTLSRLQTAELRPLAQDMREFLRDIGSDRPARDEGQVNWSPKALKDILKEELAGDEVMIVSNREPYIHSHKDGAIVATFPASGLVTALEPIMRACSGTWIAHGSGSADRETVDRNDRVQVPPDRPRYQIRRVWLSEEEEQGYYYGFSNEGLWPLCHVAYARPVFRQSDWEQYKKVNQKFADVCIQEARTDDPVILVQDYHLALVPRMIREKLPNATIITFWHIPWPNAEAFGICPWRVEILKGLLGSSILGFHTRYHCNNFIDTVDRNLESRFDRESSQVTFRGKDTAIKSYPISIEWPNRWAATQGPISEGRAEIRRLNRLPSDMILGIGVDRLDYTKGIVERFLAVESLLDRWPEWRGRFSLIQIAAPSRETLDLYHNLDVQVREQAARINAKYPGAITLKIQHHSPQQVFEYFRACDVCMVTSLHDGMNLVAKEFVSARDDELGTLILSQFTGAAREMREALIVNPYDIQQCADALHLALSMPESEQRARMRSMRGLIQEFNVYRWAGRMLIDAARMRRHDRLHERIQESGAMV
jgi:trehalose 6-phosphate synthase